jgi:hypothetical protein
MASVLPSAESGGSEETGEGGAACVRCGEAGPGSCAPAGHGINIAATPAKARHRPKPIRLPTLQKSMAGNAAPARRFSVLKRQSTLRCLTVNKLCRGAASQKMSEHHTGPKVSICPTLFHGPALRLTVLYLFMLTVVNIILVVVSTARRRSSQCTETTQVQLQEC